MDFLSIRRGWHEACLARLATAEETLACDSRPCMGSGVFCRFRSGCYQATLARLPTSICSCLNSSLSDSFLQLRISATKFVYLCPHNAARNKNAFAVVVARFCQLPL